MLTRALVSPRFFYFVNFSPAFYYRYLNAWNRLVIYQTDGFRNFKSNFLRSLSNFLFSWYCSQIRMLGKVVRQVSKQLKLREIKVCNYRQPKLEI